MASAYRNVLGRDPGIMIAVPQPAAARRRFTFNQAAQWPLAELRTEARVVRLPVQYAAWHPDRDHHLEVSDKMSMANYRANRLVRATADRAVRVFGGLGHSRRDPFACISGHQITEGAEEIQVRRVALRLSTFGKQ